MIGRVADQKKEIKDLGEFRNEEHVFRDHNNRPALRVGDAIAEHKATDPDRETDDGEFPEINQRNPQEFQPINKL